MKNVLLCSSNTILIKNLYGILRDEGCEVETVEHPAFAVQGVMNRRYDFIIIDSEPFGLSTEDAVEIIRNVAPGMPILYVGGGKDGKLSARTTGTPLDLEELKRLIQSFAA